PPPPAIAPLPLPDALPICGAGGPCGRPRAREPRDRGDLRGGLWLGEPLLRAVGAALGHDRDRLSRGSSSAPDPRGGGRVLPRVRSEEHTSELQSRENLVCR